MLITYVQPYELSPNNVVSSSWHVFNYVTGQTIRKHKLYSNFQASGEWDFPGPHFLLVSNAAIKSDRGKLAEVMLFLRRVDILDFESGEFKSIATKDSPDLNRVVSDQAKNVFHYKNLEVDDYYIYVMVEFEGKRTSGTINVFDWEGNFVRVLQVNQDAVNFAFDPIRRMLYTRTDCGIVRAMI